MLYGLCRKKHMVVALGLSLVSALHRPVLCASLAFLLHCLLLGNSRRDRLSYPWWKLRWKHLHLGLDWMSQLISKSSVLVLALAQLPCGSEVRCPVLHFRAFSICFYFFKNFSSNKSIRNVTSWKERRSRRLWNTRDWKLHWRQTSPKLYE